jgi:hypothetical protein
VRRWIFASGRKHPFPQLHAPRFPLTPFSSPRYRTAAKPHRPSEARCASHSIGRTTARRTTIRRAAARRSAAIAAAPAAAAAIAAAAVGSVVRMRCRRGVGAVESVRRTALRPGVWSSLEGAHDQADEDDRGEREDENRFDQDMPLRYLPRVTLRYEEPIIVLRSVPIRTREGAASYTSSSWAKIITVI